MDDLVELKFLVPESDVEVHRVAHSMISMTMAAGQASNGRGSHWNKDPLNYHVWKGLHHMLRLWQDQDIEARERDEPKLKHLYNAFTRIALAEAGRLKKRPEREVFLPVEEE